MKARTESGYKKIRKGQSVSEVEQRSDLKASAFRKACKADGVKVKRGKILGGITKYGATDWQELYAEAFSFYITDPELLKAIRPKTHEYFVEQHPRR